MQDEYIKDILLELIKQGLIATGKDNKETAEKIAEFVTTLRKKTE